MPRRRTLENQAERRRRYGLVFYNVRCRSLMFPADTRFCFRLRRKTELQYNARKSTALELPANDAICSFNAPRPYLLSRVAILNHCDASTTNFTAAQFHAL
ncbi:hypothetical protein EVAR_27796_1 [Eumeta japonica]|uniref:Uncharacterized protein n=1 Tax=Eumeta variegata TaxID=151549 RepID=A0A4C1VJ51_EUMVA|nr:hypothetical protein EVAR_27796_1 [Eumeta japonica]